jgi:hypothetical protein
MPYVDAPELIAFLNAMEAALREKFTMQTVLQENFPDWKERIERAAANMEVQNAITTYMAEYCETVRKIKDCLSTLEGDTPSPSVDPTKPN